MNWLIWREYQLSGLILAVGLGLLLLPYTIAAMVIIWGGPIHDVVGGIALSALYSVALIQLTPVLLGGNAIAGERADRSAQFVAYLPLTRTRRLIAKLSVMLAAMAALWGVNLLVLLLTGGFNSNISPRSFDVVQYVLWYSAITGSVFFGVAWMVSSLQSSPVFAVCAGLITPALVFVGLHMANNAIGPPNPDPYWKIAYPVVCSTLAVVCFSIGTCYYLRRIEP